MATITGLTAARMAAIEGASVVSGTIVGNDLILTKYDTTTINAGNVRGPTGAPGVTVGELAALVPVGMVVDYIGVAAPNANWLLMTGQTIVNGQTTYAALWAVLPASMKSGSNIVFPDTRGRVSVGYNSADTDFDAIGEVGGAKTHTLTEAESALKAHVHAGPSHQHSGPSHQHTINHGHSGSGSSNTVGAHTHTFGSATGTSGVHNHNADHNSDGYMGEFYVSSTYGAPGAFLYASGTDANIYTVNNTGSSGSHSHTFSGTTSSDGGHAHTIGVTVDSHAGSSGFDGTANTGSAGTGNTSPANGTASAHNNLQPYIVMQKIIKAL